MKIIQRIFILVFFSMLMVPFLFSNRRNGKISTTENRTLASRAVLFEEDGSFNEYYLRDVSSWLNDNIGFREELVSQHAAIQYYLFRGLISPIYKIGPRGEWNYVAEQVIPTYQHSNLLNENQVAAISQEFRTVNNYLQEKGIQFYYVQCWDKQSIYPEQFPDGVNQYGTISRTDQVVSRLKEEGTVHLIDTKPDLLQAKDQFETYSRMGDPAHWSSRGAYVGYLAIMQEINRNNDDRYQTLTEADYDLNLVDAGFDMPGGIHLPEEEEAFTLKDSKAVITNEKLTIDADDERDAFYTNVSCGNNTRVLIIGDSYIQMSILDDLAESFGETALIWKENIADLPDLVTAYQPDIIIYEQAERELDFKYLLAAADKITALN